MVTIQEEYTLPSLGKIYERQFDPNIKLRSMTVAEEMKRLTATDTPYKAMSEIIDDCLITKLPMSVYDLCLGDYQFLLHRLRVVTYGTNYKMTLRCPICGEIFDYEINLDDLEVFEYKPELLEMTTITLPETGKTIELKFQTPRDLDNIEKQKKIFKKKYPDLDYDPALLFNLESVIKTVDGEVITSGLLQDMIKKLPMKDSNLILNMADKLNSKIGVDINILTTCPTCLSDIHSSFRFTGEFFRPSTN